VASIRSRIAHLSYLPGALRIVWDASRKWCLLWTGLLLVQGLLPAATVYLTRPLVDALIALVQSPDDWEVIRPFLALAGAMGASMILTELISSILGGIRSYQAELVEDHISSLIHEKSISLDLAYFESPEYYDQLHRAHSGASTRALALLENTGSLLQNGISITAMAAILLPYGLWLPLVLVLSTLPALYVVVSHQLQMRHWWSATTDSRRWASYYDQILTFDWAAAEQRLFGWGSHFKNAYQDLRGRLRSERASLTRGQVISRLLASMVALAIFALVMGWMIWRTTRGTATFGDLALFYQAFSRGQSIMQSILTSAGQVYVNALFVGDLFSFLNLQPQIFSGADATPPPDVPKRGLRFRGVTFRYPGSSRLALQDFDLDIPAGQTVALVGANGAGKTTVTKLLCRFYDPEEGTIELDGIDIKTLNVEALRRMFTVMFQSPVNYIASVGYNISIGDLTAPQEGPYVTSAAHAAGAHTFIERLPSSYDTLLGKWFNSGTELSGGERQRIALARAFFRNSPIVILDEPTSFMDSWAESEWLSRFRSLVQGKTALIITHRFTTAMRADIIHVMLGGKIVESGSHGDLMSFGGLYAQSWTAQIEAARSPLPSNGNSVTYSLDDIGT
jgi:ATP-binding cassette, subfamily B, bacterial